MPVITVDGPHIKDMALKRELVKAVTDAAVKAYGLPEETIVVLIRENPPENVGVGGQLIVDRLQK